MTSAGVRTGGPAAPVEVGEGSLATLCAWWARERPNDTAITFLDYRASVDGHATSLTWRELDTRVSAVAARVQACTAPGDRVVVLARQSADYIAGLIGAIRAGAIGVPLFQPDLPGHADRLAAVLGDCAPAMALTLDEQRATLEAYLADQGISIPHIVSVDTIPDSRAADCAEVAPRPDDIAYLQYTSGSTRVPAGVVITHRNVLANARQNAECFQAAQDETTMVSWLPLFHDMGLVLAVAVPMVTSSPVVLMDPIAFLERPIRWVRALADAHGGITAAPNFAYAYAGTRVSDKEKALLDMSDVVSMVDGSEPVTMASIDRFADAFAECGLKRTAHRPSFGMAEAVVLVASGVPDTEPRAVEFDRDALTRGVAVPAAEGAAASQLVSCGWAFGQELRIVDPESGKLVDEGMVGELWLSGVNIAAGYWRRPEQTAEVFGQDLEGDGFDGRGVDGRGWLRTGDLGVLHQGELFITGRMKDLIIVDGRNHYPQDIEATVEQAHPAVRKHALVAFSVFDGGRENVMVMLERSKVVSAEDLDRAEVTRAVTAAVSHHHGLSLHDVLIVEPGGVPRTSSGKVSRAVCRKRWAEGTLKDGRA
ncbi:fatty acyl-AMP ligase [Actinokineospora pegani]|uniref:fatty acyl-AMP ligase n=1 Tax=Actinokineospora pegani TaxID=2654637 RepID=UPI0012E9A686|nr:fatty acyl-AMP ligase [Actinokineospora pegani]